MKGNYISERRTRMIASIGLIIGAIFGMAGCFVQSASLRGLAWGIDGIGLILACVLLTIHYFRKGDDVVAAGFLIFAAGESLVLSCSAINLDANFSSFGAGTGLWATSLSLIGIQKMFPMLVRCLGMIAAVLFAIVSVLIFTGHPLNPLTTPLPFYAYPFFAATIFGWAWTLLRADSFLQRR